MAFFQGTMGRFCSFLSGRQGLGCLMMENGLVWEPFNGWFGLNLRGDALQAGACCWACGLHQLQR